MLVLLMQMNYLICKWSKQTQPHSSYCGRTGCVNIYHTICPISSNVMIEIDPPIFNLSKPNKNLWGPVLVFNKRSWHVGSTVEIASEPFVKCTPPPLPSPLHPSWEAPFAPSVLLHTQMMQGLGNRVMLLCDIVPCSNYDVFGHLLCVLVISQSQSLYDLALWAGQRLQIQLHHSLPW